ncbi:MAG: Fic family protein [Anaerolineae bacterium]|nr:Fic family protein [Anaerolineae bacterium]
MDIERFRNSPAGHLVEREDDQGQYWAFVPNPLPPQLDLNDSDLVQMLSAADRALGALAGLVGTLANPRMFVLPFIRREAVLSSRIEGMQATLTDLYVYEASQMPLPGMPEMRLSTQHVREVSNYVRALEHGLERLQEAPLDRQLMSDLHARLMEGLRTPGDQEQTPGALRAGQNWIGQPGCTPQTAAYIPPPADMVPQALAGLETYLRAASDDYPPLIRLALIHYQFEAIHPFIDGNGRVGRLLLALALCKWGLLSQPLLYLSAYFQRYQNDYYDNLLAVSRDGRWHEWIIFFLRGVEHQAGAAVAMTKQLQALRDRYHEQVHAGYQRMSNWVFGVLDVLFEMPYITSQAIQRRFDVSLPTANRTLQRFEELGILAEISGRQRSRVYAALEILAVLRDGTE